MKLDEQRLNDLKKHLEILEERTGRKLRKIPRYDLWDCPMENFAPGRDKSGRKFDDVGCYSVFYLTRPRFYFRYHDIFPIESSIWWSCLSLEEKEAYTRAIIQWLKERDK